jgi:hypothetical protein
MKNIWNIFALVFMLMLLLVVSCFGADSIPVGVPFGEILSDFLKQTVFPILGALVLGFISWAVKAFGTKYKIAALADNNNFLMQIAAQAVAFAEEKGAAYAKNASPLTNSDKLNSAIAYVIQMAPKVTQEQAQSLVTSALASLPGVGATGTSAVGVAPAEATPVAPLNDPLQTLP